MKREIDRTIAEKIAEILALKLNNDSKRWIVELKPASMRSTGWRSQNHHFWGHVRQIAMETGEPLHDVARYVKERAVGMGYPYRVDRWGRLVPQSESEATKSDAVILIDAAHVVAAELSIVLQEYDESEEENDA